MLSMVCRLRSDGFWLACDGGFSPASTIYQEFTDVELTAVGVIPDTATNPEAETFVMDWPIAQGNLRSLQDLVAVQGVSNKGFFVSAPNSTESIGYRFKHRLFEVCVNTLLHYVIWAYLKYRSLTPRLKWQTRMTVSYDYRMFITHSHSRYAKQGKFSLIGPGKMMQLLRLSTNYLHKTLSSTGCTLYKPMIIIVNRSMHCGIVNIWRMLL